jgi:hypothetical protein
MSRHHEKARNVFALASLGMGACVAGTDAGSIEEAIVGGVAVTDTTPFYNDVNRSPVTLDCAICGTGVLIAPRLVLTASHNGKDGPFGSPGSQVLFGPNGGSPDEVVPVALEIDWPGSCSQCEPWSVPPWTSNVDLGIWVLERPASVALPFWAPDPAAVGDDVVFFGVGVNGASAPPWPIWSTSCGGSTSAGVFLEDSVAPHGDRFYTECDGGSEPGDSGGPIFDQATHELLGINIGFTSGPPGPSVAMEVASYTPWIVEQIRRYRASLRLGDFDADDRGDLLFWNSRDLGNTVDLSAGAFPDAVSDHEFPWCTHTLVTGDFDGDGQDDLLCFDPTGNTLELNYAASRPLFGATDATLASTWCDGTIHTGDFDGNGRSDLLCRHGTALRVDLSSGVLASPFAGSDWETTTTFCSTGELFVGRLNGDSRDDLLCRKPGTSFGIRFASPSGTFAGATLSVTSAWCGQTLFTGDVDGEGHTDLICWDAAGDRIWVDLFDSTPAFPFAGVNDWGDVTFPFCGQTRQVRDMNDDGRADLLCHDDRTGLVWIDLASSSLGYDGVYDQRIPDIDAPIWPGT